MRFRSIVPQPPNRTLIASARVSEAELAEWRSGVCPWWASCYRMIEEAIKYNTKRSGVSGLILGPFRS